MRTLIIAFGLAVITSLILTRLVRDFAIKHQITTAGGGRKIHGKPLPQLGGVAVGISASVPLLALAFIYRNDFSKLILGDKPLIISLLAGGALMFSVGLYDDLKGMRARYKFLAQAAAGTLVYATGIRMEAINIPFVDLIDLGILSLPLTIFWIALITNAVNLIDGLDGLAAGVVTLAGACMLLFAITDGDSLTAILLVSMLGGTIGFLFFNLNPASIILGDTGSLTLGFWLGLISLHSSQKSTAVFSVVAATMVLGLPIFDLSMAVIRRLLTGKPIFAPDQHHVHHLLLRRGLSQKQTLMMMVGAALLLEGLSLLFLYSNDWVSALVIVVIALLAIIAFRRLGYGSIISQGVRENINDEMESLAQTRNQMVSSFREKVVLLDTPTEAWRLFSELARELQLERAQLTTTQGDSLEWCFSNALSDNGVQLSGVTEREYELPVGRLRLFSLNEREGFSPHAELLYRSIADGLSASATNWQEE